MKKAGLYIAVILWVVIAGGYLTAGKRTHAVPLGEVFENGGIIGKEWEELHTYIEGYGQFGVCYLSEDDKEALVRDIAAAVGVCAPYGITTQNNNNMSTTILTKDGINGALLIKSITEENRRADGSLADTQYVYVKITAYNNVQCAASYRELLEGLFTAMGIEGNVNVNLVGSLKGMLNRDEKNELADELLAALDADIVAENRENDMFTIYAYSEGIKQYITLGGKKINVNIALGYDEGKNRTDVYLASPVGSLDY